MQRRSARHARQLSSPAALSVQKSTSSFTSTTKDNLTSDWSNLNRSRIATHWLEAELT